MEEQGIGRPSTYAPTVSTILDREYVVKEGKYLRITNLGRVVTALMKERFTDIADLKFTANMEQRLDSVEEGKTAWKDVLREFYGDFEQDLEQAEKDSGGRPHQGARRGQRGDLPGVRAESGGQVRPVRPLPGLSRAIPSARSPCRWWWRCRAAAPSAAGG